ncbi:MAG TPA: LAGLIDADG family homing endonuclease [Nitrososphaeraceae archaeon]|nr:LAGLIDADG family homing endonuclease [Nitrososphaeraceae archaeon]
MRNILDIIRIHKPSLHLPESLTHRQSKLFSEIHGYEDIKETLKLFLESEEPINALLTGAPACLVAETKVVLGNGRIVNIDSLGVNHLQKINQQVLTGEGNRKRAYAKVFHKYRKQRIIEIETETGKIIRGTYNHPLRVLNPSTREYTWKRLDELESTDRLVIVNRIPCLIKKPIETGFSTPIYSNRGGPRYNGNIPKYVDTDLAAVLGYGIGDGWCQKYRIGFVVSNTEREVINPLLEKMEQLFAIKPQIREYMPIPHYLNGRLILSQSMLTQITYSSLAIAQMLHYIKEKRVPDIIFRSPDIIVAEFLKWLFQADGSVSNNGRGQRQIQLKSIDLDLLRDVQLLLLRFGIWSRIDKNNLSIARGDSIIKFYRHIGFVSKNKIIKLAELVGDAKQFKFRTRQMTEKIKKISYLLEPKDVYDIEIPEGHRFIANGIISHNTAKTLFLLSMMRYCKFAYFVDASNATGPGVLDQLFGAKTDTKILLLDEIDKLKRNDQGTLLNLLETGMLISTKVRKQQKKKFHNLKVFATSNEVNKLSKALQSRFFRIHLKEYTEEEYLTIAKSLYPKNAELSEYIAKAVWHELESKDIRDFIQIAKHAKSYKMADKLIELRMKYAEEEEEEEELEE